MSNGGRCVMEDNFRKCVFYEGVDVWTIGKVVPLVKEEAVRATLTERGEGFRWQWQCGRGRGAMNKH